MPSTASGWITSTLPARKRPDPDQQNRNPSRLSRMPGILRGDKRQVLLETNFGKSCWDEWVDWLEAETDDLPDTENLAADWEHLPPPLADPLIRVLRKGHKMLLAGPSKAGKSFCPHRAVHRHCRGQSRGWASSPAPRARCCTSI